MEEIKGEIKKSVEKQERISWEAFRAESIAKAEIMISSILGYEEMSLADKSSALRFLLLNLIGDNANRVVAEIVSKQLSELEETNRHSNRMAELKAFV